MRRRVWLAGGHAALLATVGACAVDPGGSPSLYGRWGVDLDAVSAEVRPGDDFYEFVNEGWIESTALPDGAPVYGAPWEVQERITGQVRDLIADAAAGAPAPGSPERRIKDVYLSYRDLAEVDRRGLGVIRDDLDRIASITTHEQVAAWMGDLRSSSVFRLVVMPPADMRGGYMLSVAQGRATGLGLPDRVYYLSDEAPYTDIRAAYASYVSRTLEAAGVAGHEDGARRVLELETAFAEVMWDLARLRQATEAFNLVPRRELERVAPGFPWGRFLGARAVDGVESVNVGVGAIRESAALFRRVPVESWKAYLAFHWVDNHAAVLPESFGEAEFDFFSRTLFGVESRPPREDRAIAFVERALGDDVGHVYARRHLPPDAVRQVGDIVESVKRAFRERLETVGWMDDATRAEALKKLDAIFFEVGEPRVGIDWSGLRTDPADLAGNARRIREYRWAADRARIGAPVTRLGGWNMHAHRIGAGYHQQYNKVFMTAGMLQPPFFDPGADAAVNFGSLGHTVAHELGHALDDQGSRFDSEGALRDWWSPGSRAAYERRTSALIEQYGAYEALPGVPLASEQMIGEIVGDTTGTEIGFRAYELYAAARYPGGAPVLDGYTGEQRFFMATAQQYRAISSEEALRDQALNRTHPPERFRINGPLSNFGPWYEAFGVTPRHRLYRGPGERVRLW